MHMKFVASLAWLLVLGSWAQTAFAQFTPPQIGYQASLSNLSSVGISGTVTIFDADTLLLEDFTYDGRGGGQVELRLAPEQTPESFFFDGEIIALLRGPTNDVAPFLGDQDFLIDLPDDISIFDFGAISVWCVPFAIDFGSGTFQPPPEPMFVANFDDDNDVDGSDFLAWQRGFGITTEASLSNGDANNDGAVNAQDLNIFNNQFGTTNPGLSAAVVPEPSSALLISLVSTLLLAQRHRRS